MPQWDDTFPKHTNKIYSDACNNKTYSVCVPVNNTGTLGPAAALQHHWKAPKSTSFKLFICQTLVSYYNDLEFILDHFTLLVRWGWNWNLGSSKPGESLCVKYNLDCIITIGTWCVFFGRRSVPTLVLRSWFCSLLLSVVAWGKLLLEDDGSLSLSLSLSPNQEKGMQVWMDDIDSAGERFPPDSSSNSADPLMMTKTEHMQRKIF